MTIAVRISACGSAFATPATAVASSGTSGGLPKVSRPDAKMSRLAAFEIMVRPNRYGRVLPLIIR